MKKLLLTALLSLPVFVNAQPNSLLERDFWKVSPNVAAVKAEIQKGANPSQLNASAFDPVVLAINNNAATETVKFLLEQPGNGVDKLTHDGRIYLHWAAYMGNAELVNYLISKGADINLEDSHGYSPVAFAVNSGQSNTAVYDALFKAGINPKRKYKDGATLIMLAMSNAKDLSLAKYFTSKGLSLKDVDSNGSTSFDYAARTGNIDNLNTLLKEGIKPTDNALINAAQGSRRSANTIDLYKYLVEEIKLKPSVTSSGGQTMLHYIARKEKQADILNYFMAKGVDANKADNEGNTALMNAAAGKDLEMLQILLTKVKDINTVNKKGESALTQAIKSSSAEIASLLINKGADIHIKDSNGNNLAYYLVESYRAPRGNGDQQDDFGDKLSFLQLKGLDLSSRQKDGSTLYHAAITKNDLDLLKKLAGLNIDVNAKSSEGMTVLHKAALIAADDTILRYLLTLGADKHSKTEFDETAFDLASENELLVKNNVSVDFLK